MFFFHVVFLNLVFYFKFLSVMVMKKLPRNNVPLLSYIVEPNEKSLKMTSIDIVLIQLKNQEFGNDAEVV